MGVVSSSESNRESEEESCDPRSPKSDSEFRFEETVNPGQIEQWSTLSLDETTLVMVGCTSESITETRFEDMFDSAAISAFQVHLDVLAYGYGPGELMGKIDFLIASINSIFRGISVIFV